MNIILYIANNKWSCLHNFHTREGIQEDANISAAHSLKLFVTDTMYIVNVKQGCLNYFLTL